MLYVLSGEDDFSIRQELERIKKGLGDREMLATNTTVLDGQRLALDHLQHACETVPFLAEKRLVVVEGLLERFEPGGRNTPKKKGENGQPQLRKEIAALLSRLPDFTVLVLLEGKLGGRNTLLKELAGKAEVKNFPLLRDDRLRQWIQQRVKGMGGSISARAVATLAGFVGSNLWLMANEIDKLVAYAQGRTIEETDVRELVSYAQEASVFAMVDAILESRVTLAARLLEQLLQQGAAPSYLLVMLARQVRILVQVKEMRRQRKTRKEIQDGLGTSSEFVLRKALEQADSCTLERLKEVYHRLLEADVSIKTGKFDGDLALDILLAELCRGGAAWAG